MKKNDVTLWLFIIGCFFCGSIISSAQITNGPTGVVNILEGSKLIIDSHLHNEGEGIINNEGTVEIKGNIDSGTDATFTSSGASRIVFLGEEESNLKIASDDVLNDVQLNKESSQVNLESEIKLNGDIIFEMEVNHLVLGDFDLVLGEDSEIEYDLGDGTYIVTNGQGMVTKKNLQGPFTFPVGYTTDTRNDIELTESGYMDDISVRVLPNAIDGIAGTTISKDVVATTWHIEEAMPEESTLSVKALWSESDETEYFNNGRCGVFYYDFDDDQYKQIDELDGSSSGSSYKTITSDGFFQLNGMTYLIVADNSLLPAAELNAKVLLQGAYDVNSDMMHDKLRTKDLLPLEEPYTDMASFSHVGFGGSESVSSYDDFDYDANGDDIVDWVFIEIRNQSDEVVSTKSALIQRDGDIVDVEGENESVKFENLVAGDYHVVVRHRNHLGVKSSNTISMQIDQVSSYDFTTSANQVVGDQQAELESGVYGIYGGNANGGSSIPIALKQIRMTGPSAINDHLAILLELNGDYTNVLNDVYLEEDITMDGVVRMTGPSSINDGLKLLSILDGVYTNIITRFF